MSDDGSDLPKEAKILVVDDVLSARKIVVRMLSHLGFKSVIEAESVASALAKVEAEKFDLVIADVHLKDGLGIDLLIKVKGENPKPPMPFLFVTSDMEKETFKNAVQLGASSYLLKPFTSANLIGKLRECLG